MRLSLSIRKGVLPFLVCFTLIACSKSSSVSSQVDNKRKDQYLTSYDFVRSGTLSPNHISEQRRIPIETYELFEFLEDGNYVRQIRVANGQEDSLSISTLGLRNVLILSETGQWLSAYPLLFFFDVQTRALRVDNTYKVERIDTIQREIYLFTKGELEEHRILLGYKNRDLLQYDALEKGEYDFLVEK